MATPELGGKGGLCDAVDDINTQSPNLPAPSDHGMGPDSTSCATTADIAFGTSTIKNFTPGAHLKTAYALNSGDSAIRRRPMGRVLRWLCGHRARVTSGGEHAEATGGAASANGYSDMQSAGAGVPTRVSRSWSQRAAERAANTWRRFVAAAFLPPPNSKAEFSVEEGGVLYSLLSRQVEVGVSAWDDYAAELGNRDTRHVQPRRSIFGLPLLHPRCGAALCWFGVMLLFDCVFTAFWTPVNVAFCLDQYGRLGAPCTRTDLAGGCIYLLNILMCFQVGVTLVSGYRLREVLDGVDSALLYCRTAAFWLDVLAVVPFVYLLVLLGLGDSVPRNQTVSIISLIRLVRLFRVAGIVRSVYTNSVGGEYRPSWLADNFSITGVYVVLLGYMACLLVNLYACILLLLAYYERKRMTWMDSIDWTNVRQLPGELKWFYAVYFVITVMTTTGFADFTPKAIPEQVVINVVALNGLLTFGAVVAVIGDALKRSQQAAQEAYDSRRTLTSIRRWMDEQKLPEGTQTDVLTFFTELGAKKEEGRTEGDIVFELPAHLRQRVVRQVIHEQLSRCPLMAALQPEVVELMAAQCVPLELPTGHDLFRLCDDAESCGLWLLEEGAVAALRNVEPLELPAGAAGGGVPCLLGEACLLADVLPGCSNRLWTIRTQRPCRVWQLRGPSLRAALRMYPDTADRALEFVRGRLTAWMEGRPEDEDGTWCELVQLLKRCLVAGPLRDRIHDCYLALQLAKLDDGSLVRLLSAWVDLSATREMNAEDLEERVTSGRLSTGVGRLAGVISPAVQQVREYDLVTPAGSPMTSPGSLAGDMNALAGGGGGALHPLARSPLGLPGGGAMAGGDGDGGGGGSGVSAMLDGRASGVSAEAVDWVVRQTPTLSAARGRLSLPGTLSRAFSASTEGTAAAAAAAVASMAADAGGNADVTLSGAAAVDGHRMQGISADGSSPIDAAAATAADQMQQQQPPTEGLARSLVKQRSLPVPDRASAAAPQGMQQPLQPLPLGALPACTRSARYSLPGQALVAAAVAAAASARESNSSTLGPLERRIVAGDGSLLPPVQSAVEQALAQLRSPLRRRPRSSRFLSDTGSVPRSFQKAAGQPPSPAPAGGGAGDATAVRQGGDRVSYGAPLAMAGSSSAGRGTAEQDWLPQGASVNGVDGGAVALMLGAAAAGADGQEQGQGQASLRQSPLVGGGGGGAGVGLAGLWRRGSSRGSAGAGGSGQGDAEAQPEAVVGVPRSVFISPAASRRVRSQFRAPAEQVEEEEEQDGDGEAREGAPEAAERVGLELSGRQESEGGAEVDRTSWQGRLSRGGGAVKAAVAAAAAAVTRSGGGGGGGGGSRRSMSARRLLPAAQEEEGRVRQRSSESGLGLTAGDGGRDEDVGDSLQHGGEGEGGDILGGGSNGGVGAGGSARPKRVSEPGQVAAYLRMLSKGTRPVHADAAGAPLHGGALGSAATNRLLATAAATCTVPTASSGEAAVYTPDANTSSMGASAGATAGGGSGKAGGHTSSALAIPTTSHTTFINKIMQAAGVPPPPPPPGAVHQPQPLATSAAVTITAPPCTVCGCATCAYCGTTIAPPSALAVMVPKKPAPAAAAAATPAGTGAATAANPAAANEAGVTSPRHRVVPNPLFAAGSGGMARAGSGGVARAGSRQDAPSGTDPGKAVRLGSGPEARFNRSVTARHAAPSRQPANHRQPHLNRATSYSSGAANRSRVGAAAAAAAAGGLPSPLAVSASGRRAHVPSTSPYSIGAGGGTGSAINGGSGGGDALLRVGPRAQPLASPVPFTRSHTTASRLQHSTTADLAAGAWPVGSSIRTTAAAGGSSPFDTATASAAAGPVPLAPMASPVHSPLLTPSLVAALGAMSFSRLHGSGRVPAPVAADPSTGVPPPLQPPPQPPLPHNVSLLHQAQNSARFSASLVSRGASASTIPDADLVMTAPLFREAQSMRGAQWAAAAAAVAAAASSATAPEEGGAAGAEGGYGGARSEAQLGAPGATSIGVNGVSGAPDAATAGTGPGAGTGAEGSLGGGVGLAGRGGVQAAAGETADGLVGMGASEALAGVVVEGHGEQGRGGASAGGARQRSRGGGVQHRPSGTMDLI